MSQEGKLYDALAAEAARIGRRLTKAEWLAVAGPFFKERKRAGVNEKAEQVYALYPKKVGRDEALRAISKALKTHPLEYLMDKTNQFREAVEAWPSSYRYFQDGGDRCPNPATFYNQGRFQDDPKEWRRAGARTAPRLSTFRPTPEATEQEKAAQESENAKLRAMPEPKDQNSLEHAMWVEAQRGATVTAFVESTTQTVLAVEAEQHLRKA